MQKSNLHTLKMTENCVAMQAKTFRQSLYTIDKENGCSSNACICLHRSLKLSTDDHSDFVAVKLKIGYMFSCNCIVLY